MTPSDPASNRSAAIARTETGDAANALIASFLGWTLDAFDYFVLIFVLSRAATEFNVTVTRMSTAILVTLLFRPVGAFIFGLLADRYGRRRPMMANLVFYSFMEVCSGLAPDFTTFLVCRALFGIGMGGEWGVGASLAMEKVPPRWRGILSGMLQQGYATGYLLAAFCFRFMPDTWNWRSLFFIGGLPALLALFVRAKVKESAVWEKHRHADWAGLRAAIWHNRKTFAYIALLMTMMNFISHGTQDLYPTFLEKERHFSKNQVGNIAMVYNLGAICGGTFFGFLSDRVGRRRGMVLALFGALLMITPWSLGGTANTLALGAFGIQFMVQGAWGVIPAHISELSPNSVRGFLPGFAYQCGVAIASIAPTLQARMAETRTYASAMSFTAYTVFTIGAIVILLGKERAGCDFESEA